MSEMNQTPEKRAAKLDANWEITHDCSDPDALIADVVTEICDAVQEALNEHLPHCDYKPEELLGQPIGQHHCPICGTMIVAGISHGPVDVQAWHGMQVFEMVGMIKRLIAVHPANHQSNELLERRIKGLKKVPIDEREPDSQFAINQAQILIDARKMVNE